MPMDARSKRARVHKSEGSNPAGYPQKRGVICARVDTHCLAVDPRKALSSITRSQADLLTTNCTQAAAAELRQGGQDDGVANLDQVPNDVLDAEEADGATGMSDEEEAEALLGSSDPAESIAEALEEEEAGEAPTTVAARLDVSSMGVAALKEALGARGLARSGNKDTSTLATLCTCGLPSRGIDLVCPQAPPGACWRRSLGRHAEWSTKSTRAVLCSCRRCVWHVRCSPRNVPEVR